MFTREDFGNLSQNPSGPCISIFLPTHRKAKDIEKDPIRLKNLLREAQQQLIQQDIRPASARGLLEPATELLEDNYFWRHQEDGLAIFLGPERFEYFRESISFPSLALVLPEFYLLPLLPALDSRWEFYVLALSQNRVRLFENDGSGVRNVDISSVPGSLEEALIHEEAETQLQYHSGGPRGSGGRSAVFHGQGVGVDDTKDRIQRFLQQVDAGLRSVLGSKSLPLVLAAVDYLVPIYHRVNTYPHLVEEAIPGNPDELDGPVLAERAVTVLEPHFRKPFRRSVEEFLKLSGTGKTSESVEEILRAVVEGRVQNLFVARDHLIWGRFDEKRMSLDLHDEYSPGDSELRNWCALRAKKTGAAVFWEDRGLLPGSSLLSASFRY